MKKRPSMWRNFVTRRTEVVGIEVNPAIEGVDKARGVS